MKPYVTALLAALAAAPASAEQAASPEAYAPMMAAPGAGSYSPYMMMPFGLPLGQVPAMVPYGVPMQPVPYVPYVPYNAPAIPAPASAPAVAPPAAPATVPATPGTNPYLTDLPVNALSVLLAPANVGPRKPYEMRRVITQAEKTQMVQMALPVMTNIMRMAMPDVMNYMARKYKAKPGLSFDDVRDSLFLRANQLNMKKVGENLMWKDFQAVLADPNAPRIEVYSFCDIAVARELLQISPEFIVFLPCRVAVVEDADKSVWVLMLDWNLDWVAGYERQLGLPGALLQGAQSINDRMDEMMRAAANGDL